MLTTKHSALRHIVFSETLIAKIQQEGVANRPELRLRIFQQCTRPCLQCLSVVQVLRVLQQPIDLVPGVTDILPLPQSARSKREKF